MFLDELIVVAVFQSKMWPWLVSLYLSEIILGCIWTAIKLYSTNFFAMTKRLVLVWKLLLHYQL
jgi:hypothetical protein